MDGLVYGKGCPARMTEVTDRLREIELRMMPTTPGPWESCGEERGGCTCGFVNGPGDYAQVATVEQGEWGDTYPALRIKNDFQEGNLSNGSTVELEAYSEKIPYGRMPTGEGKANAIFIAHAREDIPWLMTQVRVLTAQLEKATVESK
jgi:hypothetical protein